MVNDVNDYLPLICINPSSSLVIIDATANQLQLFNSQAQYPQNNYSSLLYYAADNFVRDPFVEIEHQPVYYIIIIMLQF